MTVLVFLDAAHGNGRIVDPTKPQLMANDLGVTRGDGVFESLLAVNGAPRKERAHLDRLASSAAALDLTIPASDAWSRAIHTALDEFTATEPEHSEAVVKLVATRGTEGAAEPTSWVQVSPVSPGIRQQQAAGVEVLLLERGYDSTVAQRAPWLLMGAKTLSYAVNMAAVRYAKSRGADDVIFTSSDGKVLEGPTSTVLLARGGGSAKTLLTPQLESGILPGTSQGALFEAARGSGWDLGYGPLEPHHLLEADAVWLISSVRLLTPVTAIDGTPISTSEELTRELSALVDRFV